MADGGTTVTDEWAFKSGSLRKQFLFAMITFGIYTIYWMHRLHKSIAMGTDADVNVALRTVGLFIPIYNFVILWRDSHDLEEVTDTAGIYTFITFLFAGPAAWFYIQSSINGMYGKYGTKRTDYGSY